MHQKTAKHSIMRLSETAIYLPAETELDKFAAFAERTGGITDADWSTIWAEDYEAEMVYRPEGGLTEEHYLRLGGSPWQRALLAWAVLMNLLRGRGYNLWTISSVLYDIDKETLPNLIEEHSFRTMADALEAMFHSRRTPGEISQGDRRPVSAGHLGECPSSNLQPTEPPIDAIARGDSGQPNLEEIAARLRGVEVEMDMLRQAIRHGKSFGGCSGLTFLTNEQAAAFLHMPVRSLLTEEEAIEYLRLDTIDISDPSATLRRYREMGLLRGTQVSKRVFYLPSELDAFLKKLTERNPR